MIYFQYQNELGAVFMFSPLRKALGFIELKYLGNGSFVILVVFVSV